MHVVYLASWPRSGNTMLRAILWHCFGIRSGSRYVEAGTLHHVAIRDLVGSLPWYPSGKEAAQAMSGQAIFVMKTHELTNASSDVPAIYLVRDGREACVSNWKFINIRQRDGKQADATEEIPLVDVIQGSYEEQEDFGSWSEHLEAWSPKTRPNTLLLRYEDMVADVPGTVRQVGEFIHREPMKDEIPPFEVFQEVQPAFFRSGTNETWRDLMSPEGIELFWSLHRNAMDRYGYPERVGMMEQVCR